MTATKYPTTERALIAGIGFPRGLAFPQGLWEYLTARTRALGAADIEAILSMDVPIREKTLWTMLYETAARSSEVLALDIEDLDRRNRRSKVTRKIGGRHHRLADRDGPPAPQAARRPHERPGVPH